MTTCSNRRFTPPNPNVAVEPRPTHVLAGSGGAFMLALFFFALFWFRQDGLLKSHPFLVIRFVLTLISAPTFFFISIRRMSEIGIQRQLVFSMLVSAMAIGLIALAFVVSLGHLTRA